MDPAPTKKGKIKEGAPLFINTIAMQYPSKGPQTKTEGMVNAIPKIFKFLRIC